MIVLDTSIWIEYLKRNSEYTLIIDKFLRERTILGFDFIFGELLQGARVNEKEKITGLWEILPKISINGIGYQAGIYSLEHNLKDKGIGLIDCSIICATIQSNAILWTLDKKIRTILDKEYLYDGTMLE